MLPDDADQPSVDPEISPFLTGVVIFLGPALACWIGLIEAALSILHLFHPH